MYADDSTKDRGALERSRVRPRNPQLYVQRRRFGVSRESDVAIIDDAAERIRRVSEENSGEARTAAEAEQGRSERGEQTRKRRNPRDNGHG